MATKKKPTSATPHKITRTVPARAASIDPPRVGELWPGQGGRYLGAIRGEQGQPDYHLVGLDHELKGAWGPTSKVPGALSDYDGLANTQAMAAAGSKLAKKVLGLNLHGHQDYYIAARQEARLGYVNGKGHFPAAWHWTSTQYEFLDGSAWIQSFGYGGQSTYRKSNECRAFVVRRIPIQ